MSQKSMMIISSDWYGQPTFRMIPISKDCPYTEVIYDAKSETLAIISKETKDKPQMLVKLDGKGNATQAQGSTKENPKFVEERRILPANHEYYIENKKEIMTFVEHFAVGMTTLAKKIVEGSVAPGIITSSKEGTTLLKV